MRILTYLVRILSYSTNPGCLDGVSVAGILSDVTELESVGDLDVLVDTLTPMVGVCEVVSVRKERTEK